MMKANTAERLPRAENILVLSTEPCYILEEQAMEAVKKNVVYNSDINPLTMTEDD
jgi:hypothetical protein